MMAKHAGDAVLGAGGVTDILVTQADQPTQRLLLSRRDVNRSQMTTTVKPNEVDRVEAIGFTAVTGPSRDERGRDDLAVKAVTGEHTL